MELGWGGLARGEFEAVSTGLMVCVGRQGLFRNSIGECGSWVGPCVG